MLSYLQNPAIAAGEPIAIRSLDPPSTNLRLAPRETLPLGTEDGGMFFFLADGCIALTRYMPDGRRQICDIIGPGRMFGFSIQGASQCMAESLTYSTIERHGRRTAWATLPDEVGRMLNRQQSHALLLGRKTATERVATALIDLAEQFGRKVKYTRSRRVDFPLFPTRGDLADWLGLTLETVSRCLHRLRRARVIEFSRPELIRILDFDELERVSGAHA